MQRMKPNKFSFFRGIAFAVTLLFSTPLLAITPQINFNINNPNATNQAVGQAINMQWQQSSISLPQLQNLMASNPGHSLYNISFPNGTSWAISPAQLQSLTQEARRLGYNVPDLSFSSLGTNLQSGMNNAINSIPISQVSNSIDQSTDAALRELRYQQMHLSDALPDWLKNGILWVSNAFTTVWDLIVEIWNFLVQKYHQYF